MQIAVVCEQKNTELDRFMIIANDLVAETAPLVIVELPRQATPPLVRGGEATHVQVPVTASARVSEYPELLPTRSEGDADGRVAV
jgi:hypothetical protein